MDGGREEERREAEEDEFWRRAGGGAEGETEGLSAVSMDVDNCAFC